MDTEQGAAGASDEQVGDTQDAGSDGGNGAKVVSLKISTFLLKDLRKVPYIDPAHLVVAGDPSTQKGADLAGTFLDDGRALLPWSGDHEAIVTGLLCSSDFLQIAERVATLDADGRPVLGADGQPTFVDQKVKAAVSRGQPELVYIQGSDESWFAIMADGRQRRRAALELQRRLDWLATLCNSPAWGIKTPVWRRNAAIKLGAAYAGGSSKRAKTPEGRGMDWGDLHVAGLLPEGALRYDSPEVGDTLHWLDEDFVRAAFGGDELGSLTAKKAWFYKVPGPAPGQDVGDRDPSELEHVAAYRVRLKFSVVGTNVDPHDPAAFAAGIAQKEAQVPTPPSVMAEQVHRLVTLRRVPGDPKSPLVYGSRTALAKYLNKSPDALKRILLVREMCEDVQKLIDSGEMSLIFALDTRESAFVRWPEGQDRQALPPDTQRLILQHLKIELSDESGAVDYKSDSAKRQARIIRDKVLAGKLGAPGQAPAEAEPDTAVAPSQQALAPRGPAPAPGAAPAQKPKKRPAVGLDLGLLREHAARALSQLPARRPPAPGVEPAADTWSGEEHQVALRHDRLELALALTQVLQGAEPVSALDAWPDVRDVISQTLAAPQGGPAQAAATPLQVLLAYVSAAVDAMAEANADEPVVTEATLVGGRAPTPEQATEANAWIQEQVKAFRADATATLLEEFILQAVVRAGG